MSPTLWFNTVDSQVICEGYIRRITSFLYLLQSDAPLDLVVKRHARVTVHICHTTSQPIATTGNHVNQIFTCYKFDKNNGIFNFTVSAAMVPILIVQQSSSV